VKNFRVTGKITCFACIPTREMLIDDSKIQAADEALAKEAFIRKHRLCGTCLKGGTEIAVEFDPVITVEFLPSA